MDKLVLNLYKACYLSPTKMDEFIQTLGSPIPTFACDTTIPAQNRGLEQMNQPSTIRKIVFTQAPFIDVGWGYLDITKPKPKLACNPTIKDWSHGLE